eukprot:Nitzschia sp. Nitz4//scaffold293_size23253//10618//11971//NITZ4_008505-RA/size23253-augustus-gene-0.3-mRNA-1//1//CDS//3329546195//8683//frame0
MSENNSVERITAHADRYKRTAEESQNICIQAKQVSNVYLSQFDLPARKKILPVIDLNDINIGRVLGKGGFGTVYAVKSIEPSSNDDEFDSFFGENTANLPLKGRYALKILSPKALVQDDDLFNALLDNATEAKLLGCLDHPNIIKVRATPVSGMFSERSFLLLDRLEGTLRQRFKEWKDNLKQVKGVVGKVLKDPMGLRKAAVWDERMTYAADLTSALAYMHSHRVVHRDLKPENIGFDLDNKIKIFDFGLARQLPKPKTENEDVFKMTDHCGSPRYMAPEVALNRRYNEKCDVYSFAILMWEMMTLEIAFDGANGRFLKLEVWRGQRVRPELKSSWKAPLQDMFTDAWNDDIDTRPSMGEINRILCEECGATQSPESSPHVKRSIRTSVKGALVGSLNILTPAPRAA